MATLPHPVRGLDTSAGGDMTDRVTHSLIALCTDNIAAHSTHSSHLHSQAKEMVFHVRQYFQEEKDKGERERGESNGNENMTTLYNHPRPPTAVK